MNLTSGIKDPKMRKSYVKRKLDEQIDAYTAIQKQGKLSYDQFKKASGLTTNNPAQNVEKNDKMQDVEIINNNGNFGSPLNENKHININSLRVPNKIPRPILTSADKSNNNFVTPNKNENKDQQSEPYDNRNYYQFVSDQAKEKQSSSSSSSSSSSQNNILNEMVSDFGSGNNENNQVGVLPQKRIQPERAVKQKSSGIN